MAKKKAELLEEAKSLGLNVTEKNTVAEINEAIKNANDESAKDEEFAKAGKRSKKGVEEAQEKAEKTARQKGADASSDESDEDKSAESLSEEAQDKNKGPAPKTRTRVERKGKAYRKALEAIDRTKEYSLKEAVSLAQKTSTVKFDATVELHVRLNVDPKQADQNTRGSVVLPHGTGKTQRVAVFADEEDIKKAKDAGADIAAGEELLDDLKQEKINFDVLIATPQVMGKLGPFAKILGPKGLMPNPKSGTVAKNVAKAVKEAKAGRVEFRVDKQGIIHTAIGKVSFKPEEILANADSILQSIKENRPGSIKGIFIESAYITTSMGPSIRIST